MCYVQTLLLFDFGRPEASPFLPGALLVGMCQLTGPARKLAFTELSSRNINRVVKKVFSKIGAPYANSYSSHGFRRGAAQELKERGSQWTTVAGIGGWRPLAFRGYVDTTADVSNAMARLLIEDFDPSSSDEEHVLSFR